MDIACPNCAATYRVPDSLLAQGKALRCAACGHEWVPAPPAISSSAPAVMPPVMPPPAAEPPAMEPPPMAQVAAAPSIPASAEAGVAPGGSAPMRTIGPTTPPPLQPRGLPQYGGGQRPAAAATEGRRGGALLRLAWLVSAAILLLGGFALIFYSAEIALVWPPFARVTELMGR